MQAFELRDVAQAQREQKRRMFVGDSMRSDTEIRCTGALSCASRGTPLHIQRLKNVRINFLYAFHRAKRSDLSNFDFAVVLDRVHLFDVFRLIMAAFAK